MDQTKISLGVDIGGTHITAGLVDLQHKILISSSIARSAVNAAGTATEIINAWTSCIREAQQTDQPESICLAMPGPFNYQDGVSLIQGQSKYESLYGLNVKKLLAESISFPAEKIFMENDAACFLQGEVFAGSASSSEKDIVIGITLGTGLGSAVYKNGKSRSADMWCWPFKEGIAEDFISTRWFVKRWAQLTGESIRGVRELMMMSASDENIKTVFKEFADHLAAFLLDFIAQEKPNAIVIGGNISKAYDRFRTDLLLAIEPKHPSIKTVQATLGEEAQLLGAVSSWLQHEKARSHFN